MVPSLQMGWEPFGTTKPRASSILMGCNGCIHVSHPSPTAQPRELPVLTEPGGGLPIAQNRTKWPVTGGAVSFQPGWFNGHQTAFIYVNIGLGTTPLNYSHPMVPVFQLTGPSNVMYPGTFCLPQVPLPANITYNIGDNATIQIVETAIHGAALYSVSATRDMLC
jgi:hypothetical protein